MPTPAAAEIIRNPSVESLIVDCLTLDDCRQTDTGAVVAYSGKYTGRLPKDKFVVRDETTDAQIWWDNNSPMSPETFARLEAKFDAYESGLRLYVIDTFAGADPAYRIAVRFIVERPYHALFIRQLLIRPSAEELANFQPDWEVRDFGRLELDGPADGIRSEAVIALNFARQRVLIAGTQYAGEMKKSIFTVMNYLLPQRGALSMHCSANIGADGQTALFFGLSGTGKTTLSADPDRDLIGDDEHGWTDHGVFNVEGGCYAKCIRLSAESEPEIFQAIRTGAILENVVLSDRGVPDYDSDQITENTRAAYPLDHIANAVSPSVGGHPSHIVFLTCDARGVLPPIARLEGEDIVKYFLNGYTSKLAGTEVGVKEPELAFSACFGQPFLPLPPGRYADLLLAKIAQHGTRVWLVNTGWSGGPFGVGSRIKLRYTRAMLHAAFSGELDRAGYSVEPHFGLSVPNSCPDVPAELLQPRQTWADPVAYDRVADELRARFDENYARFR